MIASACRIFMNEQLHWTLQATCSCCARESAAALHMGLAIHCPHCDTPIEIDPAKTVFHREAGSGYWAY
jgi:hypothetical protein